MAYDIATIGAIDGCACHESGRGMAGATEDEAIVAGGWLPTIVWPSTVDDAKRKLDPDMRATDATVTHCAQLPTGQQLAWADFYGAWRRLADAETPTFGAANVYDEVQSYESRLHAWQKLIAEACKLNAPGVTPNAGPDTSAIKWVAGAAALVAIAYLASPLILGARRVAR
jgi:hypothetical protein